MAKVHICSIVLLFSTRGSCAASSESPIRKRFASVQVATDFDLDDLDGLANSTSTLVSSAVSPASPIRKRVASGQVAANGGIDMPHGLVDSTPKLSPTTVLKGNMREHMEINAQGNLETILANTRQVVADGSIDTYHDLADQSDTRDLFGFSRSKRYTISTPEQAPSSQIAAIHGICLASPERSTFGGKVHMWGCDMKNQNQQWTYNSGTGQIKAIHGICLDSPERSTFGGKVHMWGCDTNNQNQQWTYNSGTGQIKATNGICLDSSQRSTHGGLVHMWGCDTNNQNQQWQFGEQRSSAPGKKSPY